MGITDNKIFMHYRSSDLSHNRGKLMELGACNGDKTLHLYIKWDDLDSVDKINEQALSANGGVEWFNTVCTNGVDPRTAMTTILSWMRSLDNSNGLILSGRCMNNLLFHLEMLCYFISDFSFLKMIAPYCVDITTNAHEENEILHSLHGEWFYVNSNTGNPSVSTESIFLAHNIPNAHLQQNSLHISQVFRYLYHTMMEMRIEDGKEKAEQSQTNKADVEVLDDRYRCPSCGSVTEEDMTYPYRSPGKIALVSCVVCNTSSVIQKVA